MTIRIRITSYGTGHNDPPVATNPVTVDTTALRNPPDDPAVRRQLTQLTGIDPMVAAYVMATPGAEHLVDTARRQVEQRIKRGEQHIDVHVHCYGGRHRSVTIARELAAQLRGRGAVQVQHRHIQQPILPSRPR
jgi:UPF0042 nucleotide-binding protein